MPLRAPVSPFLAALAFLALALPPAPAASDAPPAKARDLNRPAPPPAFSVPGRPGPQLVVEQSTHDFGSVLKGTKRQHAFLVRNTGSHPLKITAVETSCGCTTAADWTREIAPRATGTIPIAFDSAQFTGPVVKTITVTSNSVDSPQTTLEIKAHVRVVIAISPSALVFPAVTDPTQSLVRSATLRHEAEGPLTLTDLDSDKPVFKPSLREIVPGREFELQVATVPPLETGTHTARITLKSSNPDMPLITVQAVATVMPPVQIAPTSVNFTGDPLSAPEKRYVIVMNHRAGDLTLSDLETNARGVTFDPQRSPDGKQFTIAVTFPAGFDARSSEKLYVRGKTSHPSTPTFEIPLRHVGPR